MKKQCEVVMLPTNEKANLYLHKTKGLCLLAPVKHQQGTYNGSNQHLYILSDDEIKKEDWCYKTDLKGYVFQWQPTTNPWYQDAKKIIATTNTSLTIPATGSGRYVYNLPQPSQSFIEKYVAEYNKSNVIIDVLIEYEEFVLENNNSTPFRINRHFTDTCEMTGIKRDAVEYFTDGGLIVRSNIFKNITIVSFPKVNSKDNTITIKKVKDSWTKEELPIDIMLNLIGYIDNPAGRKRYHPDVVEQIQELNKWLIKNNLK